MKRLLRTVTTWLVLVALPLQGYAAGVMLFCGSAHERAQVTVDHADHGHDGASHDHQATGTHGDHASAALDQLDFSHSACSVCASCCSGAALPASTLPASFAQPLASPSLRDEHVAPVRAPPRLERPPRTSLA